MFFVIVQFRADGLRSVHQGQTLLGVHLGLTQARLDGSYIDFLVDAGGSQKSLPGVDIGMFYKFEPTKALYFKSGVAAVTKECEFPGTNFVYPSEPQLRFISVPLLVGLQVIQSRVKIGLEGGMAFNFDNESHNIDEAGFPPGTDVKYKAMVSSLVIGLNVEVAVSRKTNLFANYRSSKDTSDFYENTIFKTHPGYHISSRHLTFGVLFPFGNSRRGGIVF